MTRLLRLALWLPAVRARAAAPDGPRPLHFCVNRAAGHSGPTDFDAQVQSYTDEQTFLLWQLGHPDVQPRP